MSRFSRSVVIDLQAAQSPHYRERGIARYALDFTRAVTRAAPQLVNQVLVNPAMPVISGLEPIREKVTVTTEPDWSEASKIFHVLSPFELDVPVSDLWPRQASRRGMRLVVTLYDLIPEIFPEIYLRDPGQRRRYRARRELVRAADHVVTLSRSAADDAIALLGIPSEKVTVVGAAPAEIFGPPGDRDQSLSAARQALPGLDDRFVVYNGAVEPRKNMEALLDAFAAVPGHVRSTRQLVLVCNLKPPERHHFEVRARELGISQQLLLAGYVPDELLVLLYQSAELIVYPSLYEGYGLPVAEAMACHAPVIASSTSSLQELVAPSATFDPYSTEAITEALERGLSDQAFREELIEWARNHTHTWEDVGKAAVRVYEQVLSLPETSRWRRRPLVAVVSPLPPARTGVADYTERLVESLGAVADVDVFADGDAASIASGPKPGSLPQLDRSIGGYDERLLAVGNSEFHGGALKLLRVDRIDAVVQAHDARLNGLYLHGEARGAVPEGLRAALAGMYPELKPEIEEAEQPSRVAQEHGLLMAREVVSLAREVFVTSQEAAEMIGTDVDPEDREKVAVWEYAYPSPVERSSATVEEGLICSFGLVNPLKAPDTVIRAFAETDHGAARLAFVGPISVDLLDELRGLAETLDVSDSTVFTGDIDDDQYRAWLGRAAVAVQLRGSSNGETSGAVADCLAYGIPVIVTALGPQAGLPDFVPRVDPGVTPAHLAKVIDSLLTDPECRARFADRSREFVTARSFDRAARWFVDRLQVT